MTLTGVFSLLQMAIALLVAAQAPNVPISLRNQAIEVASYAITLSNQYREGLTSVPIITDTPATTTTTTTLAEQLDTNPVPIIISDMASSTPIFGVIPEVVKPKLVDDVIPTFSENHVILTGLEFTTDKEVACAKNSKGEILGYGTHCKVEVPNQTMHFHNGCNALWDKGYYLFTQGKEYTCNIILTERNGEKTEIPFTFTVPK